jgi:hypothetical protein
MDQAYADKLDGKIPEEFWERKMSEWRAEEQQVEIALNTPSDSYADRVLSARRILELANKAHFLYVTQKPAEQAKLLRKVLSNCSVDAVSLYPTYRKPFDVIFKRAKTKEWSGREDLNLRPPGPETTVRGRKVVLMDVRNPSKKLSLSPRINIGSHHRCSGR